MLTSEAAIQNHVKYKRFDSHRGLLKSTAFVLFYLVYKFSEYVFSKICIESETFTRCFDGWKKILNVPQDLTCQSLRATAYKNDPPKRFSYG